MRCTAKASRDEYANHTNKAATVNDQAWEICITKKIKTPLQAPVLMYIDDKIRKEYQPWTEPAAPLHKLPCKKCC